MSARDVTETGQLQHAMSELAAALDAELVANGVAAVPEQVVQQMFALAVKLYAGQRAAGIEYSPVPDPESVNATEVAVATTALLATVNLDIFELSLWRHWGRP